MEITAKTKIFDLLSIYPKLEETIMNLAPPFKNLKNPLLRRTVGKLANLEKAAQIGGLDVLSLVNTLRAAVGQPELKNAPMTTTINTLNGPAWISGKPMHIIDGVEMLSRGVHPLNQINELMQTMPPGAYLVLTTNFKPIPLIEAMEKQNYKVYHSIDEQDATRHLTYIGKAGGPRQKAKG